MKTFLRAALPLGVIALGAILMTVMIKNRPEVEPRQPVDIAPLVRVAQTQPETLSMTVSSQGTVEPATQISLISEVSGVVQEVSPALSDGSYFEQGDLLIKLDPTDYRLAVVQAEARLMEAKARLIREEAEAEVARTEWEELGREGRPSPLLLREPQLAEAKATVESARASVDQAKRDLAKTTIAAPFTGRVLRKNADLGQFISRGTMLAEVYSIDIAEVRLPLPPEELAFVDLPFQFHGETDHKAKPTVHLHAQLGGRKHTWSGKVTRTEGEIDPRTRMITAVVEVRDPYGRQNKGDRPPLASGLFVTADIQGKTFENVFRLPRTALRNSNQLFLVDEQNRLTFREVDVLRSERANVIIEGGLRAGELVVLSPMETPVEGMKVRIAEENANEPATTGGIR